MKLKRQVESSGPSKLAVLFLIAGILSLVFSLYARHQILALIGLGLTFWGALFVFLRPLKLVDSSLLHNAAVSEYLTTDRILNEFRYAGKGYYIPPYPSDVYLPDYLKGLKTSVVFISAKNEGEMPSVEEIATGKFIANGQKGVLVSPPGLGILTQIEENMQVDFTKIKLYELCEVLPTFILQDLTLAKGMGMELDRDQVNLKLFDSVYKDLYSAQNNLKSVNILGCPIASAVACAIAKASGRTVTIEKHQVSPDGSAIEVWYRIIQG